MFRHTVPVPAFQHERRTIGGMSVRKVAGFASVVMLSCATLGECPCQPADPATTSATTAANVQEIRLGEVIPRGTRGWQPSPKASPDGRHLAWVVRAGDGFALAVDGQAGPPFGEIGDIPNYSGDHIWDYCAEFSDDGEHVAYTGRRGKTWHAVIDGEVGPACDEVRLGENRVFGRAGPHHAYVGRRGDRDRVIVDGQEGPAYDRVYAPTLSPDGSRVAYVAATEGRGSVVVLDGQPIGRAEDIDIYSLTFSPDGRRFVYATGGPEGAVALDGETYPLVGEIALSHLIFSPDSEHLAYVDYTGSAFSPDECWLVLDGEAGRRYRSIGMPCFVPGSGQVCYAARKGEWRDEVIVIGEDESPTYDEIDPAPIWEPLHGWWFGPAMQFSADGTRSAYCATLAGEEFVVVDGRREPAFRRVCLPVFSPDGRSLAYWAEVEEDRWAVLRDGNVGTEWDRPQYWPVFSPDSKRLAYAAILVGAAKRPQYIVVVDGKESPPWDWAQVPFFSPDSKHYAYLAESDDTHSMVLDGEEGPEYDCIHTGGEPWTPRVPFRPDGSLEYFAERGDTIYRVRQCPPGRGE
jgi:hypothetical protein